MRTHGVRFYSLQASLQSGCVRQATLVFAAWPAKGHQQSVVQVLSAAGVLQVGSAQQGTGRHSALSSAFSSSSGAPGLGWPWVEGVTAAGQLLVRLMQPARRGLAAAAAPAAPPSVSPAAAPAASLSNQSCQAIQAAAAAGAALNFSSVETFCLNQVLGPAGCLLALRQAESPRRQLSLVKQQADSVAKLGATNFMGPEAMAWGRRNVTAAFHGCPLPARSSSWAWSLPMRRPRSRWRTAQRAVAARTMPPQYAAAALAGVPAANLTEATVYGPINAAIAPLLKPASAQAGLVLRSV